MFTRLAVLLALIFCFSMLTEPSEASAQQPGWSPVVIATGEYRQQIKSLPIEQRPYRPFHFYGNTVRRSYYRGASPAGGVVPTGMFPVLTQPLSGGWWGGR